MAHDWTYRLTTRGLCNPPSIYYENPFSPLWGYLSPCALLLTTACPIGPAARSMERPTMAAMMAMDGQKATGEGLPRPIGVSLSVGEE